MLNKTQFTPICINISIDVDNINNSSPGLSTAHKNQNKKQQKQQKTNQYFHQNSKGCKFHTVSGVYLRNGMHTPRSISSCSMASLDLPNKKALLSSPPVAVKLLLVAAPLADLSVAEAAKFEIRTAKHFLLLLLLILLCKNGYKEV